MGSAVFEISYLVYLLEVDGGPIPPSVVRGDVTNKQKYDTTW
jgi:hypothetical protein